MFLNQPQSKLGEASNSKSDIQPRSAPALELLSRAVSSVGICTVPAVPTQGAIPEEGGYKKRGDHIKKINFPSFIDILFMFCVCIFLLV